MKYILISVFCISAQLSTAQVNTFEKKIDSLTNELTNAKTDSFKAHFLLELGKQYQAIEEYDRALHYGDQNVFHQCLI